MKIEDIVDRFRTKPEEANGEAQEKALRRQLDDLERQAALFNESIGLVRAALAIATQGEQNEQHNVQKLSQLLQKTDSTPATSKTSEETSHLEKSFLLGMELSTDHWRHQLLNTHILRTLYHQILEIKRQFLHHWRELLNHQITQLPEGRQPLLRSILESALQGVVVVGVERSETNYYQELQQMLKTSAPEYGEDLKEALPHPMLGQEGYATQALFEQLLTQSPQKSKAPKKAVSKKTSKKAKTKKASKKTSKSKKATQKTS